MKLHANAALSLKGRRQLCQRVLEDEGWTVTEAAAAAEVSVRCARKWIGRYQAEGEVGLRDRSSAPGSIPHRTSERRVQAIAALRRLRFTGPEIAEVLGMAPSTVSAILTRIGMGKLGRVGLEPAQRYERERPGELVHIDIKKLGRIERGAGARIVGMANRGSRPKRTDAAGVNRQTAGWEYVHIAVDDCTRLAYAEVLRNHKAPAVVAFLRRAVQFFARHGVTVERVLTDNGSSYCGTVHAIACRALGIRHLRTRPYRPQTNGKAERFIRTLLGGWAYGAVYRNSAERTAALDGWLWYYNHQRRHSALGHKPPIARLNERTNLPGTYTYARPERDRRPIRGVRVTAAGGWDPALLLATDESQGAGQNNFSGRIGCGPGRAGLRSARVRPVRAGRDGLTAVSPPNLRSGHRRRRLSALTRLVKLSGGRG